MNRVLNNTEKIVYELRALYSRYGYLPYRMQKFEEYDLYSRNKDFLISDSVITFTDTNGKLMALKPDVTLSIIKNNRGLSGSTRKLFYNENVYRVSKGSNSFREIMQTGAECIGAVDSYLIGENLYLAARSLSVISEHYVLDVSSLDILNAMVDAVTDSKELQDELVKCVSEKNTHSILALCRENEIDPALAAPLTELVSLYGSYTEAMPRLQRLCEEYGCAEEARALDEALAIFRGHPLAAHIHLDFSVVSDRSYYNGLIFKGFVEGVPNAVLSGGQYDKLMKKMHRRSRAVGFAVYIDMLDRLTADDSDCDVEAVLLYDEGVPADRLIAALEELSADGRRVLAAASEPSGVRCRETYRFTQDGVIKL